MCDTTIRDLFHSLEVTLHERLRTIEDVIRVGGTRTGSPATSAAGADAHERRFDAYDRMISTFEHRFDFYQTRADAERDKKELQELRAEVERLRAELVDLRRGCGGSAGKGTSSEVLSRVPMQGIEIIPKREVTLPDVVPAAALSIENRLLLNKTARKALEAQEMGVSGLKDLASLAEADEEEVEVVEEGEDENEVVDVEGEEAEEEVEEEMEEAEEEVEEEVEEAEEEGLEETDVEEEEEAEEEAADESEAEVELEEFEYKGSTYYRDGEGNVYMADEDGELMEDPIGTWNEAKQRIIVKKA